MRSGSHFVDRLGAFAKQPGYRNYHCFMTTVRSNSRACICVSALEYDFIMKICYQIFAKLPKHYPRIHALANVRRTTFINTEKGETKHL